MAVLHRIQIRRLHPLFAAEALDADLPSLHEDGFDLLRRTFERESVLVIRDAFITPEQHVAFSRRLGPLEVHVMSQFNLPDHPEVLRVSNEREGGKPVGLADAGRYWHSDLSYVAQPSLGSALLARALPSSGGDTLFASQHAAYDALPEATKARLRGLHAEHSYPYRMAIQSRLTGRPPLTEAQRAAVPPVVHPIVRRHDATGRQALFVNEGFTTRILDLPEEESRALLDELFTAATAPTVIYRHAWQPGDLVLWDNRAVQHLATPYPDDESRIMHRTTIRGVTPVPA
ncbi:TauD/TfdA dioxygenase family protein [Roseomonas sp. CCTCC AB2023176]|uniref:TauD/TfdA dioxygenase family protein n=1 Tax=Roseomonas sp. CCTCC AB2023176 TaxID=3342640 RepID=UPI0035DEFDAC